MTNNLSNIPKANLPRNTQIMKK